MLLIANVGFVEELDEEYDQCSVYYEGKQVATESADGSALAVYDAALYEKSKNTIIDTAKCAC